MTHTCDVRKFAHFRSNCHKIEYVRLSKLLYLLLYQHIIFHLFHNVCCLDNAFKGNIRWSQPFANNRDHKSTSTYNSPTRKYLESSYFHHKHIPTISPINNPQIRSNLMTALGSQKLYLNPLTRSIPIDGDLGPTIRHESLRQYLPSGPPPFKPPMVAFHEASRKTYEQLKQTLIFKRMYKPKVYYLFLDTLRHLKLLAETLSRKKLAIAGAKHEALQKVLNKIAWAGSNALKLKWPLVMLNPKFLKEILSNPTFLVMLFHAVEVAYMSMPMNFWLKPLMKMIAQRSPEKEEEIWWRRKMIYDTLNGHGASELQPNLKKAHFRNPGEPSPIAIPTIVHMFRNLMDRPSPDPTYHKHVSTGPSEQASDNVVLSPHGNYLDELDHPSSNKDPQQMTNAQEEAFLANQIGMNRKNKDPENAATTLVENESSDWPLEMMESSVVSQSINPESSQNHQLAIAPTIQEDWLSQQPSEDQLMSQHEFDSLDPKEKDMVLREARQRFEESKWANELIKEHNDFINAFTHQDQTPDQLSSIQLPDAQTNTESSEPPREEDSEKSKRRYSSLGSTHNKLNRS